MRDVLLILGIAVISLVALRKPAFGMICFVGASLLNPHSLTWGFARSFPFAQWIAVGTLGGYLFSAEERKFPKQREFFILLALWGTFIASTPLAIESDAALTRCISTSKILLMVFLSMSLINSEERLRILIRVIALALGFHGLKGGIFAVITGGNYMVEGPENSFLEANNAIGLALAMNVPILFHLSRVEKDNRLIWLLRAMLMFSYPAVICTFSRGAWLGLAAATVLIVLRLKTSHKALVLLAALILVPVVSQMLPQRVANRYDDLRNYETEDSAQSRFWNWELCTRVGFSHPILGGGFDYYSPYIYNTYFPEFLERWPGRWWSCHSMWFTVLGEHGFLAIILYVALIVSCMISLRRIRTAGKTLGKPFLVELANMLQGAFVAYMVSGTFLDVAYFDLFYQLVAVVIITKNRVAFPPVASFRGEFATSFALEKSSKPTKREASILQKGRELWRKRLYFASPFSQNRSLPAKMGASLRFPRTPSRRTCPVRLENPQFGVYLSPGWLDFPGIGSGLGFKQLLGARFDLGFRRPHCVNCPALI